MAFPSGDQAANILSGAEAAVEGLGIAAVCIHPVKLFAIEPCPYHWMKSRLTIRRPVGQQKIRSPS
jgi:hypothetical protein